MHRFCLPCVTNCATLPAQTQLPRCNAGQWISLYTHLSSWMAMADLLWLCLHPCTAHLQGTTLFLMYVMVAMITMTRMAFTMLSTSRRVILVVPDGSLDSWLHTLSLLHGLHDLFFSYNWFWFGVLEAIQGHVTGCKPATPLFSWFQWLHFTLLGRRRWTYSCTLHAIWSHFWWWWIHDLISLVQLPLLPPSECGQRHKWKYRVAYV